MAQKTLAWERIERDQEAGMVVIRFFGGLKIESLLYAESHTFPSFLILVSESFLRGKSMPVSRQIPAKRPFKTLFTGETGKIIGKKSR